jgi:hypothetical protein
MFAMAPGALSRLGHRWARAGLIPPLPCVANDLSRHSFWSERGMVVTIAKALL